MSILVTGAFGNVGRSTLAALSERGANWIAFDTDTSKNRALARRLCKDHGVVFGDIRDQKALANAIRMLDKAGSAPHTVIHLAAIIPPASDRNPGLAESVNVGGTEAVTRACENADPPCRLVHASSIAVYGDRVSNFNITVDDPLSPCADDSYGAQKVRAEAVVRAARCPWTVLRLSYVVWRKKLAMDPLMFRMPLATKLEVVHTEDAGRAFANAALADDGDWAMIEGKSFNIGGGASCRTDYRTYLDRMLLLFGMGGIKAIPEADFSKKGFHCGWLDSDIADSILHFRGKTIEDYYTEVKRETRFVRLIAWTVRAPFSRWLDRSSPYRASFPSPV